MALAPIKVTIQGVDKFSKNFKRINKQLSTVQNLTKKAGSAMTRFVSLPVAAGFIASAKAGYDFSKSINTIQAKTQESDKAMVSLRKSIKGTGREFGLQNKKLAKGGEFLAQAGFSTKDIAKHLPTVAKLSAATGTEFDRTADIISNILGGFDAGKSQLDRFSNVLAFTAAKANVDLEMLGQTFQGIAPIAHNTLGFTVEQMSALVGVLGDAGVQGTKAETGIKNIILGLGDYADELKAAGIAILDIEGNARGPVKIFADIANKLKDLDKISKGKVLDKLVGKRAISAFSILLADSTKLDSKITSLTETMNGFKNQADGTESVLDKMFNTIKKGNVGKIDRMFSAVANTLIGISDSGAFDQIIGFFESMARSIGDFVKENPAMTKTLVTIAGFAALVGPVLLFAGALMTVVAAVIALNFAFLANPITWIVLGIVAAVGALIAGIVYLTHKFGGFSNLLKVTGGLIMSTLLTPFNLVSIALEGIVSLMAKIPGLGGLNDFVKNRQEERKKGMLKYTGNASSTVWGMMSDVIDGQSKASTWTPEGATYADTGTRADKTLDQVAANRKQKEDVMTKFTFDATKLPDWIKMEIDGKGTTQTNGNEGTFMAGSGF